MKASNPNKHRKQVAVSELEEVGSEVASKRKLRVQSPSFQSGKYTEIAGSMRGISFKEIVARYSNALMAANCATADTGGGDDGGIETSVRRKLIRRDVEAAVILMELSNDHLWLFKTKLQSPSINGACLGQRNGNSTRVGGESINNDDVDEFGTNGSSLLKLKKKAERSCMGRQVEVDDHCISAENDHEEIELPISSLKRKKRSKSSLEKCGLKKVNAEPSEAASQEPEDSILEPFKKQRSDLRCPIIHPGFSFSIVHLLSAIRTAMITPGEHIDVPCLAISEIVERVRLNPRDPCILEAREPLQELVRGAMAIFSSTTAPLGAKAWKALTIYSKGDKRWYWIGPIAIKPHNDGNEDITSEAWGLPRGTILKLVNCFAEWLKIARESLQKIGNLPAPPLTLMHQTISVKERLLEIRPRKTVATIGQCPEEIRDYFRKEEAVRYFIPDRAFSYTALDGRKSTVAPLRRGSGKPSSKCREHFMLKADRPPNITVLSLVRDAAARLPDGLGTRADVCVLLRDSQYIVEEISEDQLNQVVSGALDRLHYELDPCVRYNSEKKLWFYLHGDRAEDDFEYDATLSTKKRRRQGGSP